MANPDSDDYELMPSHELDEIRREVTVLKNNSLRDGEKARALVDSMDRLVISINRLITILDDAQKDIIDEYQESKPTEKLNRLLDQNQAIAKALIAITENMNSGASRNIFSSASPQSSALSQSSYSTNPDAQAAYQGSTPQSSTPISNIPPAGFRSNYQVIDNQQPSLPSNPQSPQPMFTMPPNPSAPIGTANLPAQMTSMYDLPPMDSIPPLDNPAPAPPKKKFLGMG